MRQWRACARGPWRPPPEDPRLRGRGRAVDFPLARTPCCIALRAMRIAIVDDSAARASVIQEGVAALDDCEIFVVTERRGLVARIEEIAPDIVLMDLGNPS